MYNIYNYNYICLLNRECNFFQDLFESISDHRKIVLLLFLIKDEKILLKEFGFSKGIINQLSLEFKNILLREYEQYLDYIKNEKKSVIERYMNKQSCIIPIY